MMRIGNRALSSIVFTAMLLTGCAANNGQPPEAGDPAGQDIPTAQDDQSEQTSPGSVQDQIDEAKNETVELVFFDSGSFDASLSEALNRNTGRVEVKAASPFDLNDIPDRLEEWLAAVQGRGGQVKAEAIPQDGQATRGLATELIDLVIMSYKGIQDEKRYSTASAYDVRVRYREGDGIVEEAVFLRRP